MAHFNHFNLTPERNFMLKPHADLIIVNIIFKDRECTVLVLIGCSASIGDARLEALSVQRCGRTGLSDGRTICRRMGVSSLFGTRKFSAGPLEFSIGSLVARTRIC